MLLARIIGAEWLRRRVTSSRLRHHYLSPSERSEQRHMADFARHLAVAGNQKSMTYANREGGRGGRGKTGSLVGLFVRRRRRQRQHVHHCNWKTEQRTASSTYN